MKNCGYFVAAIEQAEKCLLEQPDHWRARLCMAESLAGARQIEAACECYQKLDNPSEELRKSDEGVEELHWMTVLPGLADCYVSLDNVEPAAAIYQRVMDHYLVEVEDAVSGDADDGQYNYLDTIEEDFPRAASAVTKLMAVWYQQGNLASIRTLLESLDKTDTGYSSTRLTGVLRYNAVDDGFHEKLRALVTDAASFDFVNTAYVAATEATENEYLDRSLAIRFYWGMLNWLCGSLGSCQDQSLDIWKELIETDIPDDAAGTCFTMRIKACKNLPQALLHRARELRPGSAEAESYIERLKALADRISSVTDDRNEDPELTLGRYYHLAGDEDQAKSALTKRMEDIFKDWNEGPYGFSQHLELVSHCMSQRAIGICGYLLKPCDRWATLLSVCDVLMKRM